MAHHLEQAGDGERRHAILSITKSVGAVAVGNCAVLVLARVIGSIEIVKHLAPETTMLYV